MIDSVREVDGWLANVAAAGDSGMAIEPEELEPYLPPSERFGEPAPVQSEAAEQDSVVNEYRPLSIAELATSYPCLKPPIINGLLREGETGGIHAKSKLGKSWLAYYIGLNVASGFWLWGKYECTQGRVLLIDYELHPENLASRIPNVANAMHLQPEDYQDLFHVLPMRGRIRSLLDLAPVLDAFEKDAYKLIILDPLYRMIPAGTSENDNAAMAQVFNLMDSYAASTGAAFLFIHHQSKGSQTEKDVVDVGSGAGSIARAVDSHIVLRPHEEEGCVVMDAALRSFAPIDPIVLRWDFPLWTLADGLDPALLKKAKPGGDQRQQQKDQEGKGKILAVLAGGPRTRRSLRTLAGMGADRLNKLASQLIEEGAIETIFIETESQECLRLVPGL